ncbi:hypothetical protein niasHS_003028 [Heterodera schachtii]|uniref:Uncharacterized protein n=1 Tax=Heterodera schachtii TaxID=97005 RepID=A0ABD2K9H4_HETSC
MAPTGTRFFGIMMMSDGRGTNENKNSKSNADSENDVGTTATSGEVPMKSCSICSANNSKTNENNKNNATKTTSSRMIGNGTKMLSSCRHWHQQAWYKMAGTSCRRSGTMTSSTTTTATTTAKTTMMLPGWTLLLVAYCVCLALGMVGTMGASAELIPSKMFNHNNNNNNNNDQKQLGANDFAGNPQRQVVDGGNNNNLLLAQPSAYQLQKQMMMRAAMASAAKAAEQKQRQHHHHHNPHHNHHHHQHNVKMGEDGSSKFGVVEQEGKGNHQLSAAAPQIMFIKLLDGEEQPAALIESSKSGIDGNDGNNKFLLPIGSYELARSLSSSSSSSSSSTGEDDDKVPSASVAVRSAQVPFLPKRKKSVRRCGTLLLKHIQTVCGGCLRSPNPSEADEALIMGKRDGESQMEFRNRIKKQAPGFNKITDICCTQRACEDDEVKPFCC